MDRDLAERVWTTSLVRHPTLSSRMAFSGQAEGKVTARRYAECGHVVASRRGTARGPVDEALDALGLARMVVAVLPDYPAAIAVAGASDLVALVTRSFLDHPLGREAAPAHPGIRSFPLPVVTRSITVSQMWHPRMDADPAHRWLRGLVRAVCARC